MQCVAPSTSSYVLILLAVAVFVTMAAVVLACLAHITTDILLIVVQILAHNWNIKFVLLSTHHPLLLILSVIMSSQTGVRVADEVAWSKLYADHQLLQTVLGLLQSERLENSCEEGRSLDKRDKPSPVEQQLQETLADTIELLRALDDGHTLHETWRPALHSSHIEQIRALGTVLVNTYADRIQQVRYRTNDLVFKCARLYIWQQWSVFQSIIAAVLADTFVFVAPTLTNWHHTAFSAAGSSSTSKCGTSRACPRREQSPKAHLSDMETQDSSDGT